MTYDPATHKHYCDVCQRERSGSQLSTPFRCWDKKTKHICLGCIERGAYWCLACMDVHESLNDCSQWLLPLNV